MLDNAGHVAMYLNLPRGTSSVGDSIGDPLEGAGTEPLHTPSTQRFINGLDS